jgi:lysozyme
MELELLMSYDLSSLPPQARVSVAILVVSAGTLVGIANFEDYRGTAYIPVKGDVPTIGYGSTKDVKMGDTTTPARALMRLNDEIEGVYASELKKCITAPLYLYEFGSYVSLAYSVGASTVCRKAKPDEPPNLIDLINSEKYAEACARISAFNKGPGRRVLPGLVKRRAYERAQCEGKKGLD